MCKYISHECMLKARSKTVSPCSAQFIIAQRVGHHQRIRTVHRYTCYTFKTFGMFRSYSIGSYSNIAAKGSRPTTLTSRREPAEPGVTDVWVCLQTNADSRIPIRIVLLVSLFTCLPFSTTTTTSSRECRWSNAFPLALQHS